MSIGQEPIEKRNVINLRLLTKNSRKKVDKKSGKKQPRPFDYEIEPIVEPAPDSVYLGNTPKTPKTPASVIKNIKTPTPNSTSKAPVSKKKLQFNLEPIYEHRAFTDTELPDLNCAFTSSEKRTHTQIEDEVSMCTIDKTLPVKKEN